MFGKSYKLVIFSFVFGGIALFILLSIVVSVFVTIFQGLEKDDQTIQTKKYRYTDYNPDTEISSHGIVSLNKDLSLEEFISYESSEGHQICISNFDSTEYVCKGTCMCERPEVEERRMPKILTYFLISQVAVVVAAGAPFLAMKLAEKRFLKNCRNLLIEDCEDEFIKAYVESCEEDKTSLAKYLGSEIEEEEITPPPEPEEPEKPRIPSLLREPEITGSADVLCQGRCRARVKDVEPQELRDQANAFGCEDMQLHQQFHMQLSYSFMRYVIEDYLVIFDAKGIFRNDYLTPYCESQSIVGDGTTSLCESGPKTEMYCVHV